MDVHPGARRILNDVGDSWLDALVSRSGSDRTTLLLEEAAQRASAMTPADISRRYRSDRFVRPANVDARRLLELHVQAVAAVSPPFELIDLAPLVPLGAHATIGGVAQDRVVATVRPSEVAADPTLGLTLEAVNRRAGQPIVRVCAVQRVVRTDQSSDPLHLGHFTLLGLVTAGRDRGRSAFEREALVEHVRLLASVARRAGVKDPSVRLTDFDGSCGALVDAVASDLVTELPVEMWPDRAKGRGYYPSVGFHIFATHEGQEIGVGDGGLVDWSQRLLNNRKERLVTSGISLERLLMLEG